jgi:hypothetical protein
VLLVCLDYIFLVLKLVLVFIFFLLRCSLQFVCDESEKKEKKKIYLGLIFVN